MIRDRITFEKYFGRGPSQNKGDDKVINFMRAYEGQRDKLEKHIDIIEKELDKTKAQCLELENNNFSLKQGLIKNVTNNYKQENDVSSYLDNAL